MRASVLVGLFFSTFTLLSLPRFSPRWFSSIWSLSHKVICRSRSERMYWHITLLSSLSLLPLLLPYFTFQQFLLTPISALFACLACSVAPRPDSSLFLLCLEGYLSLLIHCHRLAACCPVLSQSCSSLWLLSSFFFFFFVVFTPSWPALQLSASSPFVFSYFTAYLCDFLLRHMRESF